MDKNKSRTDLLAAGRKKLQQFRQKKDSKGSSSNAGKSSKKSGKSEQHVSDADAATTASMSVASSHITDGKIETDMDNKLGVTESSGLQSLTDSSAPELNAPSLDSSSATITDASVEPEMASNIELDLQAQGVGEADSELPVQNEGQSTQDVGADTREVDSEGGATDDHMSAPVDMLSLRAPVTTAVSDAIGVEREGEEREQSLLLPEAISDASLMQTREDQVTDVGTMQDADGLDGKKSFESCETEISGQKKPPLPEVIENAQALSGITLRQTGVEETSHEVDQIGKAVEVSSSSEAGTVFTNLERETFPGSSHEELHLSGEDKGLPEELNQQNVLVGSVCVDKIDNFSMGAYEVNSARPLVISPISDVSSINLLQLTEIVSRLSEEEYQLLLKSRRTVSNLDSEASGAVSPGCGFPEPFERLKEELFLGNLMNDILTMQLTEQLELQQESDNHCCQLIDELSQLRASHSEIHEKNQNLAEELANCRVELHDVASKSVELQNQFISAKAEAEALSARVLELQNSFEMSQKDSLDLSTELTDCRSLVTALQAENKDINETLALMIKEKNKIEEEKEFHLFETKKLSTELADFNGSVEELRTENSNLSARLSLATEEKNKIETEAEHLTHEIDRLSVELVESKDLVASLQLENSNLNRNLKLSSEQLIKLEEDKQSVVLETQILSSLIVSLQEQLSIEKGEHMRFEVDLKEAAVHLEQLTKENIFLKSNLEVYKAKIEEIGDKHHHILSQQAQHREEQSEGSAIAISDDSLGFDSLKMHWDEKEKILVELEEAIDCLHSQSVSSARSGGKVSSPRVSKLIQAFDSKPHQGGHEVERRDSSETHRPSDPFILTKEQIKNLRALLAKSRQNVQNVGALFKRELDNIKTNDARYNELKDQDEALKLHCSNLEASNIELTVQYEAAMHLLGDIQEKKKDLEGLCEALKEENIHYKAKNNKIFEKLGNCQLKISRLHIDLYEIQQGSNHLASVIDSQVENLQKEVTQRAMLLEQGWNSSMAEIVELAGKLDESLEQFSSTISAGAYDSWDISNRLAVSVNAAIEVIVDLQKKLEAAYIEHETFSTSYGEMNTKCNDLHGKNELAVGVLHKIYSDLRKLVHSYCGSIDEDKVDIQSEALPDLLNYSSYETIMKFLEDTLNRRLELESVTKDIKSELMHREKEWDELNMRCLDLDALSKIVEEVEGVLEVEDMKIKMNEAPISCLQSLVASLVQKTREAELQVLMAKEGYGTKAMELSTLQENMHYLETQCTEHENEILILKESLRQAEEARIAACSELHVKTSELEQSEQRVSSIREKLSIAVAKGKGLVVQRDGLKQSLAETSSELEKCLQELQLKDARLNEVETKLKTYAEAGERVEAMESELSYIRNSSNALRESFLLKDSALQRIEEILEDLDLPEQFHSRDLIEKIDWLARLATGNSLPMNDWDQKSSAGGGSCSDAGFVVTDGWKEGVQLQSDSGERRRSYSDAGFVVTDGWKEGIQLQSDSGEDFKNNFEELQSKYYRLAEQNEMLEQSLMERNNLVQRWEELVDRIDMPSHLQSMETADRIEWLGRALVEANHHRDSLQLKLEKYDSYCGLLNADLEESQRRVFALQAELRAVTSEREHLSDRVKVLMYECEKLSEQTRQAEHENEKLYSEITSLEEKLEQKSAIEEQKLTIEGKIRELHDLVGDVLQESKTENLDGGGESIDTFEVLMRTLIENYTTTLSAIKPAYGDAIDGQQTQEADATLHEERSRDIDDKEETAFASLKKDLEETLHELMHVKEERDRYLEKQISLSGEVEALTKRTEELQELLNQEEQKSASVREKLNVAVRKGKSLVQQRDSLKKTIEEMNNEMESLKSENNNWKHTLAEFSGKFRDLSTYTDKVGLEPESECITNDPVKTLEWLGRLCSGLHAAVASLEQESRKSKRAADLLLAELNEVQERNDGFQEELAKVSGELGDLRKGRDLAEAAKLEALSHLENLSALHMEERKSYFAEIKGLKSSLNQLHKGFSEAGKLLVDAFLVDLESFQSVKAALESCMKANNAANVVDSSVTGGHDGILRMLSDTKKSFVSADSWSEMIDHFDDNSLVEGCRLLGHQLQEFLVEIGSLKESIHMHLSLAQEQDKTLSQLVVSIQKDMISQRESYEAMKKEIGEKDGELDALRENIAYLYEACANSITVIEYGRADLIGNKSASSDLGIGFQAASYDDGILPFSGKVRLISEEYIKTVADRLLSAAKEFASIKIEKLDANQKEMKDTITNLQRELQEKDAQRDRICMDLVNQIKAAEAAANSYFQDLESSKIREQNLVKQVDEIEAERKLLEQKVNALQDRQETIAELEEKIRSQTDLLSGKDQEIEALTNALDEEEMQMEELTKKNEELEQAVQQKNLKIENLEASNGKVMKKLSITVNKFDELHHMSASLLAEVESLQSQLQERDAEISFLRQEVTRCTNDVLLASQSSNKRTSDQILEFLTWVDGMISRDGMHDMQPDVKDNNQVYEYKEVLHKKLISLLSEMENLRAVVESKDVLLQIESSKVEELTRKAEALEMSLREKDSRLNLLESVEESGGGASANSEIVEVEPVINKWTAAVTSVSPQVRSLRKGNNDHVAIAVDIDPGSTSRIEDEDDDKVHGFKPLTSSKIVPLPRFTRPLTDMIDGLWVSCDRALMRQPVLRLGIIIYWAIMHTLLAFFVV